jgi:hypothetical protein
MSHIAYPGRDRRCRSGFFWAVQVLHYVEFGISTGLQVRTSRIDLRPNQLLDLGIVSDQTTEARHDKQAVGVAPDSAPLLHSRNGRHENHSERGISVRPPLGEWPPRQKRYCFS